MNKYVIGFTDEHGEKKSVSVDASSEKDARSRAKVLAPPNAHSFHVISGPQKEKTKTHEKGGYEHTL